MKLIHCLFILLIHFSFSKAQDDQSFIIRGKIDTIPNAMYELYYEKDGETYIDTIYLDDKSEFTYKGYISEPTRLFLFIENTYDKRLVRQYTAYNFWIEPNGEINFFGNKKLGDKIVKGSKIELFAIAFQQQLDSLSSQKKSKEDYKQAVSELYKNSINKYLDHYYAVWLLYSGLKNKNVDDIYALDIYEKLKDDLKSTYLGIDIANMIKLKIGNSFPDFEIPDAKGEIVNLKKFEGKYVLVDLWASWCPPCRSEHPNLVNVYKKYAGEGFEIVSISLDDSKEKWLQAISEDNLIWTNVSNLSGIKKDPISKKLSVTSIPDNFLIDQKGFIIARGLRGDRLIKELEKIFE
ncbi:AhpC/TSA family protein [Sphingobacterium olei]|uniref:AhpC/TSA family protein n=1 Tax=Sphingobacterium olei TaxID=2571155 RepID=A0A4V5MJP7_9SPHI|nr:TlpA disulfide reductase family protein [Sphingobacterium olei]TJZ50048.1 AhpC/TSA family protein [Sphingobacterium olei]